MPKKETIIYESSRSALLNNLAQLQRLQEEGIKVGTLLEETWDRVVELTERRDEKKLTELRKELKIVKKPVKDVIIGC